MDKMTLKNLRAKVKGLGLTDQDSINRIICSLVGHSRIETGCFGYHYCGRCGDQVGDTLASTYYGAQKCVLIGHDCDTCHANFKKCTWRDKLNVRDPFIEDQDKAPILLKL